MLCYHTPMSTPERWHFPTPDTPEEKPSSATPEQIPDNKEARANQLLDEIDQLVPAAATPDDYDALGRKLSAIEQLYAPETALEKELRLHEQYESQKHILKTTGILETLPSGQEGITGIDGQAYPYPAYDEVAERIKNQEAVLQEKAEQGFTKLLVVPFGMSLDQLLDTYKATILKHHKAGKLLATKKNPADPDEPLELNNEEPLWVWDQYQGADTDGRLVYYPAVFDAEQHQGKTKQTVINERGAWNILLVEDLPNLPREGNGKTKHNRPQLEANKTPREYLDLLRTNAAYAHEQGLTPEDHVILAITHLEHTNQVIDDYRGNGSAAYNLGAYFPAAGNVPSADWDRDHCQASVGGDDPDNRGSDSGSRAAVGV